MFRFICRSKVQNAVITKKNLRYSGSIGIDRKILKAAGLCRGEIVQVLNLNNGIRLETYIIEEPAGSGTVGLYGPAARLGEQGDPVVILAYGMVDEPELGAVKMKVVKLGKKNKIKGQALL